MTIDASSDLGRSTMIGCILLNAFLGCFYLWTDIEIYILSHVYHFERRIDYSYTTPYEIDSINQTF
jgi:hypothetical protein